MTGCFLDEFSWFTLTAAVSFCNFPWAGLLSHHWEHYLANRLGHVFIAYISDQTWRTRFGLPIAKRGLFAQERSKVRAGFPFLRRGLPISLFFIVSEALGLRRFIAGITVVLLERSLYVLNLASLVEKEQLSEIVKALLSQSENVRLFHPRIYCWRRLKVSFLVKVLLWDIQRGFLLEGFFGNNFSKTEVRSFLLWRRLLITFLACFWHI